MHFSSGVVGQVAYCLTFINALRQSAIKCFTHIFFSLKWIQTQIPADPCKGSLAISAVFVTSDVLLRSAMTNLIWC